MHGKHDLFICCIYYIYLLLLTIYVLDQLTSLLTFQYIVFNNTSAVNVCAE